MSQYYIQKQKKKKYTIPSSRFEELLDSVNQVVNDVNSETVTRQLSNQEEGLYRKFSQVKAESDALSLSPKNFSFDQPPTGTSVAISTDASESTIDVDVNEQTELQTAFEASRVLSDYVLES